MPDAYQIKSREVASHSDDTGTTRLYRAGKRWQLLAGLGLAGKAGDNRWASDDEARAFLQMHGPAEALAEFFPGAAPAFQKEVSIDSEEGRALVAAAQAISVDDQGVVYDRETGDPVKTKPTKKKDTA